MELPAAYGKYHLLEKLATGGMAEVFLAKSFGAAGFERLLAVKKILPHMAEDQEFITMFVDEARIASTLNHSNVVQINELGKEENCYYIAMEYVFGKDMAKIFDRLRDTGQAMPIPLAALIVSRICEGLDYAHRKHDAGGKHLNIIHRDVSPGNVLVSYDGDVKIIDFGIAKARNRRGETTAGTLKGKFGYMSPEQVRGVRLDHRTDIFTVGILLYEMLTGERLFGGASDMGTLEKVRSAVIPAPSDINSKIPFKLEQVVLRALARDAEKRYTWANELQEELARFLMFDGTLVTTKTLSRFMRELFAPEIASENERMAVYRRRGYPWVDEALAKTDAPARVPDPAAPQPQEPIHHEPVIEDPAREYDKQTHPVGHPYLGDTEADDDEETEVLDPDQVWKEMPPANQVVVDEGATVVVHNMLEIEKLQASVEPSLPITPRDTPAPRTTEDRPALGDDEPDETVREGKPVVDQEHKRTEERPRVRRKRTDTQPVRGKTPITEQGPLTTPARKRGLSALVAVFAFLAGLGVAGVAGYFIFLHKPQKTASPDQPAPEAKLAAADMQPLKPAEPSLPAKTPPAEEAAAEPPQPEPKAEKASEPPPKKEAPPAPPPAPAKEVAPPKPEKKPVVVAKAQPPPPRPRKNPPVKKVVRKPPKEISTDEVVEEPAKPKKKPRPPKQVARADSTRLVIKSTPPGALILLNGKKSGTTPATIADLEVNRNYFVVLKKDGYKNFFKGVKFPGKQTLTVSAALISKSGAAPKATAPKAVSSKPKGFLIANTRPWARVIVDGKDTGLWTPIPKNKKIPLKPGKHKVTFKTREGKTLNISVTIQPGKTAKVIRKIP